MKDNDPSRIVDGLAELIAPLSMHELVTSYWAKRALLVKGAPDRYATLFDTDAWSRVISVMKIDEQHHVRASLDRGEQSFAGPPLPIRPEDAERWLRVGATICITGVHRFDARLAAFVDRVRAELNYPGEVGLNCYRSPAGRGFAPHFDARIASTLQISGRKRWRYSLGPAEPWPLANAHHPAFREGIPESKAAKEEHWQYLDVTQYEQADLEPGDFFMLPAGAWHSAEAGDSESLSLNLCFERISMSGLVAAILVADESGDPRLRGLEPRVAQEGLVDISHLDRDAVARIDRVIERLRELQRDPVALGRLWMSLSLYPQETGAAAAAPRNARPVTEESVVQLSSFARPIVGRYCDDAGSDRLVLTLPSSIGAREFVDIDDPAAVLFVRAAIRRQRFAVHECAAWPELAGCSDVDFVGLVEQLVECRLFEVVFP